MMTITKTSQLSGRTATMELNITPEQYEAWQPGVLIQDAFPQLTMGEREFLKTGITPEEWEEMFGVPDFG